MSNSSLQLSASRYRRSKIVHHYPVPVYAKPLLPLQSDQGEGVRKQRPGRRQQPTAGREAREGDRRQAEREDQVS